MIFTKAWNFIKKNAFYIVLGISVVAVGIITVIAANPTPIEDKQPTETVTDQQDESIAEAQSNRQYEQVLSPIPTKAPEPSPTAPAKTQTSTTGAKSKTYATLTQPLDGEIIAAFSGDKLVYNPTLNMWMTHNGIDISAEKEDEVVAALAGEITSIINDDSKGKVVEISHGNDTVTVYAGLTDTVLDVGSKVNAGQKIGSAGTPPFEESLGKHLHFEYIVSGEYKDPAKYF